MMATLKPHWVSTTPAGEQVHNNWELLLHLNLIYSDLAWVDGLIIHLYKLYQTQSASAIHSLKHDHSIPSTMYAFSFRRPCCQEDAPLGSS